MDVKNKKKDSKKKLKTGENKFSLSDYKLNSTDTEIFRLKNTYPAIKEKEIAGLLGLSVQAIYKAQNKPAYKLAEANLALTWIETIIQARKKAADRLVSFINHSNPAIALRVCEAILQLDKIDISHDAEEKQPY